ncbi:uncharacterized protein LACBIDRAFT_329228 [Laccaria bicolor S238N-H82]|uniref:Predicted protein n=1 Tax=Laccaria bicolor (strain S238N-H82 / ATCC MYA-4686) TaxID=486041 RepID=B0DHF7_LACBS|nr:uncharacterized protein LACBIDRAFT_329228 [Laccaria bicolor S238N-H82]EDR06010.1 predicted protein [Laccaria bicolor S238N-H82]|eukprot:XP_001883298.1 predicted protein [Laccaria bicolor S238N-H82]
MSMCSESPKPSDSQTKHHGSGRCWTKEESELLEKHRDEYREAGDSACANLLSDVLQKMLDILPNGKMFNKEERTAVNKTSRLGLGGTVTKEAKKCQSWATKLCIEANQAGETQPKGGERTHFDFQEQVVTAMMEKLTKKEVKRLERTAKEFNKKGVDPKLKSKLAMKNCTAWMHAFSKEIYDTMGVQVFIFGCYLKPDGTLDVSTYDFNQELGNGKDYINSQGQINIAAGQQKGSALWTAIGAKLSNFVDEEHIPEAWRAVTSEGDNLYKFLNPSKFLMEMGKKLSKSKGQRKGWATTELLSDEEATVGKGRKPGRSKGKTESRTKGKKPQDQWDSDVEEEEAWPGMAKGRPICRDSQPTKKKAADLDVKGKPRSVKEAWPKHKDQWDSDSDVEKQEVRLTNKKPVNLHVKTTTKGEDQDQWDSNVGEEQAWPNRTKAVKFKGSEEAAQKDQWDSDSDVEKQEVWPIKKKAATKNNFNVKGTGTEPGSDEEARPTKKAANFEGTKPGSGTVTEPGLDDEARPTKKAIDILKPKAKPGPSESFWEMDLAEPLGGRGMKRKYSDDEEDALPNKTSRLEAGYKLGPKNSRPGKIKKAAGSPVMQDVSIDKPSTEVDPHAGRGPSTNIDLVKLAMANPVKAKPKP